MSVVERIALRKRRCLDESHKRVNCDFNLGSAAELERLWSVAKKILKDNRKSMTPLLFEALLFLKVNNSYWGLELACEAMKTARSAKVKARIEEDAEQAEIDASEEKDEEYYCNMHCTQRSNWYCIAYGISEGNPYQYYWNHPYS